MRLMLPTAALVGLCACASFNLDPDLGDSGPEDSAADAIPSERITCEWFIESNCWTELRGEASECALGGHGEGELLLDNTFCGYEDDVGVVDFPEPIEPISSWVAEHGSFSLTVEGQTCLEYELMDGEQSGEWNLVYGEQSFAVHLQGNDIVYTCPDGQSYRFDLDDVDDCPEYFTKQPGITRAYVESDPPMITAALTGGEEDLFRCVGGSEASP